MLNIPNAEIHPKLLNPLILAYIGDAVYELCARQTVLLHGERPVKELHRSTVALVQAAAQSDGFLRVEGMLTQEELSIYKRGRNASPNTMAKNATSAQYHRATGLEALFGYLYLTGRQERIWTLFNAVCNPETATKKEPMAQ